MSTKKIFSSLGAAFYMASAVPALADVEIVGLEELRDLCSRQQDHEQIKPGKVNFQCNKSLEFWVHSGSSPVRLPNQGSMCVQAYIKGQKHSTDSWSMPFATEGQMGQCESYTQWKATTSYTEPGSCDLLNKIATLGSESQYCELKMEEEGLTSATQETIRQIQAHPEKADEIRRGPGVAMFSQTGLEKNCEHYCPAPEPKEGPEWGSSSSSSDSSTSSSTSTSANGNDPASDDYDVERNNELYRQLGARVQETTIRKNLLQAHYKGLLLEEQPAVGSSLYKLGLRNGDFVYKINGKRTDSVEELAKAIETAKEKGKAVVKYYRMDEKEVMTLAEFG